MIMGNRIVVNFFLFLLVIMFGFYIDSIAHKEIVQLTKLTIFVIAFTTVTLIITGAAIGSLVGLEKFKMLRAQRKTLEKDADVLSVIASPGAQVYVRDTNHKATWHSLSLEPRVYSNGRYSEPNAIELNNWQYFNAPTARINANLLLNGPTQQQPIDLLTALDNQQRVLIVGPSDAGKTTLLQWLISRKLNSSKVVVIDPHSYPGKYPAGAAVIGLGRNYTEIDNALKALVRLMTRRYDDIGRGVVAEMGHSRISIFIDEWRAITGNLGNSASDAIKALLTESRKAAFSVFVASHSDRAKPLGLVGEYDLKDGFALVRLQNVNGQRQATIDTGNGEILASLPGPYQTVTEVIDNGDFELLNSPQEPSQEETRILELHRAGHSLNEIARKVYGSSGGHQVRKIKDILTRVNV